MQWVAYAKSAHRNRLTEGNRCLTEGHFDPSIASSPKFLREAPRTIARHPYPPPMVFSRRTSRS